ncbi:MAG: redoxin domain-containing protein, partial [Terriglobia bacterium]
SVDSVFANRAFAQQIGVTYPLLSDFHRNISAEYGVLNPAKDTANRTTFLIDKQGIIRHIQKDRAAIDPNGTMQACSIVDHEKK